MTSSTASTLLALAAQTATLLASILVALRYFGGAILTKTIREALGPELAKLETFERELFRLKQDHESLAGSLVVRRSEIDRRMGATDGLLSQLPAIRATLDSLSSELGRANSTSERAMAAIHELAIAVGRLQGSHEELARRTAR